MLNAERRQSSRYNPVGLRAKITVIPTSIQPGEIEMEGDVVDISQTGIKIRLDTPTAADLNGKISIRLELPDSGIPINISGILRHQTSFRDLGLQYLDRENIVDMDRYMLECIKRSPDLSI